MKDEYMEALQRLKDLCLDKSVCAACPITITCKRWMGTDRELCDFLEEAQKEVEEVEGDDI